MAIPLFLRYFLVGIPAGVTLLDTVGWIAKVEGVSMQPVLNPKFNESDYIFLNRWGIRNYDIQRGDIVSIISPKSPEQIFIKRVIAISGDIVKTLGYREDILQIPSGHCWIEGDHTGHSLDSNTFGPVSVGLITGKAVCIIWPPSRWQFLNYSTPKHRLPLNLAESEPI